jgi:hypothetical protein
VASAAELRRHADHCRYLADLTPSPQDKQVLRRSADDFDSEATRVDGKSGGRAAAERRTQKS